VTSAAPRFAPAGARKYDSRSWPKGSIQRYFKLAVVFTRIKERWFKSEFRKEKGPKNIFPLYFYRVFFPKCLYGAVRYGRFRSFVKCALFPLPLLFLAYLRRRQLGFTTLGIYIQSTKLPKVFLHLFRITVIYPQKCQVGRFSPRLAPVLPNINRNLGQISPVMTYQ